MSRRFVSAVAAICLSLSAMSAVASPSQAAPAACPAAFVKYMPKIEKAVSSAHEQFNAGDPKKTPGLMRQAIAAAKKARKGATGELKSLLNELIAIGDSPYSVSMMVGVMIELQDLQIRDC